MKRNETVEYFAALKRLIGGKPKILEKGVKISNDAVSIEAGRKKGSIKKSRGSFVILIAAIREAAENQRRDHSRPARNARGSASPLEDVARERDDALVREMSLVIELRELRERLAKMTGENVLPIRRNFLPKNDPSRNGRK